MVILKKKEAMNDKEIKQLVENESKTEKKAIVKEDKAVPLFVKLDKYKNILDVLNDVKSILFFAKNTLNVQKQIEILLEENKRLLEDAIAKLDQKIIILEKELTKPGIYETKTEEHKEVSDIDSVIEELKKQIESLKVDLKNIA